MVFNIQNKFLLPSEHRNDFIVLNHTDVIALKRRKKRNEYMRKYSKTPKAKEYNKNYLKNYYQKIGKYKQKMPKEIAKRHLYRKTSQRFKDSKNAWMREYFQRPETKEKRNATFKSEKAKQRPSYPTNLYHSNPEFRTKVLLRNNLRKSMNRYGNGKMMNSQAYGIDFLKIAKHLGTPPSDGKKYHIDHIYPCCSFNLTKPDQVKLAFAPENLRWLSEEENRKKIKSDKKMSLRRLK